MSRFNVRIYGICIQHNQVLVNEELIKGRTVIKFPGGGLDLGEGPIDGLKREWKEELNLDIEITDHFYTTDFYQPSAFDDSQVISIYYFVHIADDAPLINLVPGERSYWLPLNALTAETFTLPIDRVVGDMLRKLFV